MNNCPIKFPFSNYNCLTNRKPKITNSINYETSGLRDYMTTPLIECIPNFSEARRPEVIDQIAATITSVEGARLLDRSSDLDHNRTVLTFAGPPEAVEEAAFRAIQTASELIDLNNHTGEHPRIGATDVVPFVPLSGATIEDCIAIAKRLGQRVGDELSIPVYCMKQRRRIPNAQISKTSARVNM